MGKRTALPFDSDARADPVSASALDPLAETAPASKGGVVYHRVRREILLGVVGGGELLLEQRIAEAASCSQGTAREALMRLEREGLVERRGYRGTIVVELSAPEVAEMVRIRESIECGGLRRSVPTFSAVVLDRLARFADAMDAERGAGRNKYRLGELDRGFHLCLLREANLPALEPVFLRCILAQHRVSSKPDQGRPVNLSTGDQHRELIECVRSGDVDLAARTLREHIRTMVRIGAPQLLEFLRSPCP